MISDEEAEVEATRLVAGATQARFIFYTNGQLWYELLRTVPLREVFNDPRCAGDALVPLAIPFKFAIHTDSVTPGTDVPPSGDASLFRQYVVAHLKR